VILPSLYPRPTVGSHGENFGFELREYHSSVTEKRQLWSPNMLFQFRGARVHKFRMKWRFICFLVVANLNLSLATKEELQQKSTTPRQPSLEMRKLFTAFLGTWRVTKKIEPSQTMTKGGVGHGEENFRSGPGGASLIEEIHLKEPSGETSGMVVEWWDEKPQGYQAVWCDSENPHGCILMAHLAKWEGDQFVLRDEFEKNGKKFSFKEVFSEITPNSFTQTLYQGEVDKELTPLATIHATRSGPH
jgi:hypothetical protein